MSSAELIAELTDICTRQAEIIKAQAYVLERFRAQVREEEALAEAAAIDHQQLVLRREQVHHRRFHGRSPGARQEHRPGILPAFASFFTSLSLSSITEENSGVRK